MTMKKIEYEGLTFDDISLLPDKSNVLPKDVNLQTQLARKSSTEYSHHIRGNGHCHGVGDGNCCRP